MGVCWPQLCPPARPLPLTHSPARQLPPGTSLGDFLVTLWRLCREQGQGRGGRETPVSGSASNLRAGQGNSTGMGSVLLA